MKLSLSNTSSLLKETLYVSFEKLPGYRRCYRLSGTSVCSRDKNRVNSVDDSIISLNIGRHVGTLGRTLGFQTNNGKVKPVFTVLSVCGKCSTLESFLVSGKRI